MFKIISKLAAVLVIVAIAASAWVDKDLAWVSARKNYWAFQKPKRADVPALQDAWARTPIDAFLSEAMRAKGVRPSPDLSKERLFRRLSLDLTGLPANTGELDRFLADRSPNSYETAVDRLMASAQYGERWGQRWLDVVR